MAQQHPRKRRILAAATLAVAAIALAACSGGANASDAQPTGGKGRTLTLWHYESADGAMGKAWDQAIKTFEKETGAKVKVEWQEWSNYTTKLDSTFSGTTGIPDAVELALAAVEEGAQQPGLHLLPPHYIDRGSVAAPPGS